MQSEHPSTEGRWAAASRPRLSHRQLECLAWVQEGKSAGDIGQILGISGRTVEGHLARACDALGVRTRVQAVLRARDLALLQAQGRAQAEPSPRHLAAADATASALQAELAEQAACDGRLV